MHNHDDNTTTPAAQVIDVRLGNMVESRIDSSVLPAPSSFRWDLQWWANDISRRAAIDGEWDQLNRLPQAVDLQERITELLAEIDAWDARQFAEAADLRQRIAGVGDAISLLYYGPPNEGRATEGGMS